MVGVPPSRPEGLAGWVFAFLLFLGGVLQIQQANRTPPELVIPFRFDPKRLPPQERRRYFRKKLILSALVFPALSLWQAYNLNRLEVGDLKESRLWSPIALLYNHFGYWPAVMAMPIIGIVVLSIWLFKLNNQGSER